MHSYKSSIGCFPTCYRLNTYTLESFKLLLCKICVAKWLTLCSSFSTLPLNSLNSLRAFISLMYFYDSCLVISLNLINKHYAFSLSLLSVTLGLTSIIPSSTLILLPSPSRMTSYWYLETLNHLSPSTGIFEVSSLLIERTI